MSTYSKEIWQALKNLSIEQNKSGHERIPKNIPSDFIPDFIRGLWDGDGFIRDNLTGIGLVGSKECLEFV